MTMTLAHPADEDLGRFVEATLDDAGRAAIVAHIADCDECRIMVVDSAEFVEPKVAVSDRPRWLAAAALVILVAGSPLFTWIQRDRLADLSAASAPLPSAPLQARLKGFPHWPTLRGGENDDSDPKGSDAKVNVELEAYLVLTHGGDDAKTLHAHGVAHLFLKDPASATAELTKATAKAPKNARYWSDLAAANIVAKRAPDAITAADHALSIDKKYPEALFNRAVALRDAGRINQAISAFNEYLSVDSTSKWADDARLYIETLSSH